MRLWLTFQYGFSFWYSVQYSCQGERGCLRSVIVFAILHVKWSARHLSESVFLFFRNYFLPPFLSYTFWRRGRGCPLIFRIYQQLWLRKYLVLLMKQTTSLLFHFPSFWLARYALPCHSFVWPLGSSIMCGGPAPVEVGLLWQVVVYVLSWWRCFI